MLCDTLKQTHRMLHLPYIPMPKIKNTKKKKDTRELNVFGYNEMEIERMWQNLSRIQFETELKERKKIK